MNTIKHLFILLFLIQVSCKSTDARTNTNKLEVPKGYTLVWNDEFNKGSKPNPEFWSYEQGFVRNNELQWYQEENAAIERGNLVITGKREIVNNPNYEAQSNNYKKNREVANYTSSSINTRGKYAFKYGIVEVRAKIDTASGMWPAIWTLGIEKGWPSNGEIDIMEYYQIDGVPHILANAGWKGKERGVSWDSNAIPFTAFLEKDSDWPNKFHIWKMDWTEDYIKLYLDDELLNTIDLSKTKNVDEFNGFQQPHYLLLNLALGSNGGELKDTSFPRSYEVDYVRIFQKL
ncbi:glycoside hydrolase family 16 protein [Leeuwenhoekiella sp. W20_SRS_FM14]|uniref:glycoside hydrolase family 16 protein n=1 Tax=Leeuwenhoekiella sp. W20_SRS_FM14 TaxID=3240270 RepID=UPI003F99D825